MLEMRQGVWKWECGRKWQRALGTHWEYVHKQLVVVVDENSTAVAQLVRA